MVIRVLRWMPRAERPADCRPAARPAAAVRPRAGAEAPPVEPVARPRHPGVRPRRPQVDRDLRHDSVVRDPSARTAFDVRPLGTRAAIAAALRNEDRAFAETRWSDARSSSGPERTWGGVRFGTRLVDTRTVRAVRGYPDRPGGGAPADRVRPERFRPAIRQHVVGAYRIRHADQAGARRTTRNQTAEAIGGLIGIGLQVALLVAAVFAAQCSERLLALGRRVVGEQRQR